MYTLIESANAHANSAKKLLEPNGQFLNSEKAAVPIFVNLLIQSLEISLKVFAIEAKIFTSDELRKRRFKNGHGIKEIADAINEKIAPSCVVDVVLPTKGFAISNAVIREMLFGKRFEPTRNSYCWRKLTYVELGKGELQIVDGAGQWVDSVQSFAQEIDSGDFSYKNG